MTTEVAKKAVLNLGRLEEDDLFEEFPVKGKNKLCNTYVHSFVNFLRLVFQKDIFSICYQIRE